MRLRSNRSFPELDELERLIQRHEPRIRVSVPARIRHGSGPRDPLYVLDLGSTDPNAPAIGLFGGIHGNERIGTKVVLSYLHSLLEQLRWDPHSQSLLERVRIVFMPLVNPVGMRLGRRGNGRRVDLMRNAPVESNAARWPLGGQRLSRYLPWYRGDARAMEPEAQALCEVVQGYLHPHVFSLALDCHSGFGARDRIWFPYARSRQPIPHLPEVFALRNLFRVGYPHHVFYRIEPQSAQYCTHGDLWDHLYDQSRQNADRLFLPLTLEIGSWLWVRKNPLQILARDGLFNPLVPHRRKRILRTHLLWFDFLVRAVAGFRQWLPNQDERDDLSSRAHQHWPELNRRRQSRD